MHAFGDASEVRWVQGSGIDVGVPRVGVEPDGTLIIEWAGFARLRVAANGGASEIAWLSSQPLNVMRKFERGAGRTIPFYVAGAMVFHAAAVSIGENALVIFGASGAGQSTAAASLCA